MATGCATRSAAETSAPQDAPVPQVAQPIATRADDPRPERAGLDAPVIWRRLPMPSGLRSDLSEDSDQLKITEVRADSNWLHLDVAHHSARAAASHPGTPATAVMLLDSCPASPPRVSGTVWLDWPDPSTLTIALADLPDGEIDLVVRAFGTQTSTSLLKHGKAVSYLPVEKRKGYSEHPGDPARGIGPSSSLDQVDCSGKEVQQ